MDKDDNARKVQHIFMGNKDETIALLPYGYGLYFPEILSYRSGFDKSVIDLMITFLIMVCVLKIFTNY